MSADVPFYLLAALAFAGALGAVTLQNTARALLSLVVFFAGIAGLYLILRADFLAAVQILVYVGAVAVLIVFAIVLTRTGQGKDEDGDAAHPRSTGMRMVGALAAALTGAILVSVVTRWSGMKGAPPGGRDMNAEQIGESMMTTFVLPFELASLLLTAALIGAVVIAVDEVQKGLRR
jgi:NADH-quinone oxidoreductase subunit J